MLAIRKFFRIISLLYIVDVYKRQEKINAMTADVDFLNAQEGYRGTSYESVFLLSASEAGLRCV